MQEQQDREERKNSLGGSDIPVILGLSSYKTPYVLYLEKLGILDAPDEETEFQYWGKMLEPVILDHFAKQNNVEVVQVPRRYHHQFQFLRATYDGFIPLWNEGLEAKCSSTYMRNEWGDNGSDEIPMTYVVQCAHYCFMENVDRWHLAALIGGNEYRQFVYNRNKELEEMILEAAVKFWACVQKRIEPDIQTISDCKLKFKSVDPEKIITADEAIRNELNRLYKIRQEVKELEKIQEQGQIEIMKYMQSAECLTHETGKPLITWKSDKRGYRRFVFKGV